MVANLSLKDGKLCTWLDHYSPVRSKYLPKITHDGDLRERKFLVYIKYAAKVNLDVLNDQGSNMQGAISCVDSNTSD